MSIVFQALPTFTAWESHKDQWGSCQRCPIGCTAKTHVLGRGKLPCEVLFIGEAPGPTEDTLGDPFVGKSGKTLNRLINETSRHFRPYSYFITNSLACYPIKEDDYEDSTHASFRAPTKEEQSNCYDRIVQVLTIASPRKLVYVGKAAGNLEKLLKTDKATWDLLVPDQRILIFHPSYINRRGGVNSVEYKRTMGNLVKFLKGDANG